MKNTMIVSVALLMASATGWGAEVKPAGALLLVSVAQLPTADAASPVKTSADNPVLAERNETPEQHDARMATWRSRPAFTKVKNQNNRSPNHSDRKARDVQDHHKQFEGYHADNLRGGV